MSRLKILNKYLNKKILGFINKKLNNCTVGKYHAEVGILLMVKNYQHYTRLDRDTTNEILKHFQESMKLGNASGMFLFAFTKFKIKSTDPKTKLIEIYQKAAALKHPGANRMLFIHYNSSHSSHSTSSSTHSHENGVHDDDKKTTYLSAAARYGFPDAIANLAISLKYQENHSVDMVRQLLHQSLADKLLGCYKVDLPIAELGFLYQHYSSSSHHYQLAAHYYAIDAFYQMENSKSRCFLANLILKGHVNASNKLADAIKLCQSAIYIQDDSYSAYAHYLLGKIYNQHQLSSHINNQNMATEHYNAAFQLFHHSRHSSITSMAYYYLGVMCQFGCGRKKDLVKAKQFYSYGLRSKCNANFYFSKYYINKCQDKLHMLKDGSRKADTQL